MIWSYLHAGVKTPEGLKFPSGSYISFANRGDSLLSEHDVHFLATNANEAVRDAHQTTEIFGPTLVYSRETMQWQMDHASLDNDIKEWIDEQAGSVMKWPLPILSATRLEWLPKVSSDLFILQTPVHLSARNENIIADLIKGGRPIAMFGSPVGGISPELEQLGGLAGLKNIDTLEQIHNAGLGKTGAEYANNIPATFPTLTSLSANQSSPEASVIYSVENNPALTLNTSKGKKVLTWDPPTFFSIGVWGKTEPKAGYRHYVCCEPLVNVWGGSAAPYTVTAGALNSLLSTTKVLHAQKIDMNQTMSICAWRTSDKAIHLLAANLEEGIRNDTDSYRHATLVLPVSWKITKLKDIWGEEGLTVNNNSVVVTLSQVQSRLFTAPVADHTGDAGHRNSYVPVPH